MARRVLTSESVTEGHPDKVADQISDLIVDEHMRLDPEAHVACETLVTTDYVLLAGEITSTARLRKKDLEQKIRALIRSIGYSREGLGFNGRTCKIDFRLHEQSPDIKQGVDVGTGLFKEQGAGDQGMMYGFACDETPDLMPLPIMLAHQLVRRLSEVRKRGILEYLRPDGKSQVSVEYNSEGQPIRVSSIVVSAQHDKKVEHEQVARDIKKHVIFPVAPEKLIDADTRFFINPTGKFVIGGPAGDTGVTGRKIIVDTYGGLVKHGGGAFSGKDPSKVDRSAAYAARHVAKSIVASGFARRCEVALSYAIGYPQPTSIDIHTFGTGKISDEQLLERIRKTFDLSPAGISRSLHLRQPIYLETAAYGHFGRTSTSNGHFTWEKALPLD